MVGAAPAIRVLGYPIVHLRGTGVPLPSRQADVLTALALAGSKGRSADWLHDRIWGGEGVRNVVGTTIYELHRRGLSVRSPTGGGPYVLDHPREDVDCQRFHDGVAALTDNPSPEQLGELLALWSDDPWARDSALPSDAWAVVRRDLSAMLEHVASLPARHRDNLHAWAQFQATFAGSELLDGLHRDPPRGPRPGVLIVDDQIGREIAEVLGGYEPEVIETYEDWEGRVASGRPFRHVCALVDLHLRSRMQDRAGLRVVAKLKELTEMPVVLMSAALPMFTDWRQLCAESGADKVMGKHNDRAEDLQPLGEFVDHLVARRG